MILSDFITRLNYVLRGLDDVPPTVDTDEWNFWVDTLNRKKDELYEDVTKTWDATYDVLSLGTIAAAAAPAYSLAASRLLAPATYVYAIDADDHRTEIDIIKAKEKDYRYRNAYIAGVNPVKLYLTTEILADDPIVGATLYLPGYFLPVDVDATDEDAFIPLPDPNWGIMAVAAEIAFSDITYEDKTADLNAKANALYKMMTAKNRRGTYNNARITPTYVNRIPGTRRR